MVNSGYKEISNCKNLKQKAFTLAEVIIVLGIIGIVAMMIIPNFVIRHQKYLTANQVKIVYTTLLQAVRLSEADNGPVSNWDFTSESYTIAGSHKFFNTYLKPYLNSPKFCSEGDTNRICGYPMSANGVNYMLNNGVGFSVVTWEGIFQPNTPNQAYIAIDINNAKGPNVIGKDVFLFTIDPADGFKPYGYKKGMPRQEIIDGYHIAKDNLLIKCKDTTTYGRHLCSALLLHDGWEIKDGYPWN